MKTKTMSHAEGCLTVDHQEINCHCVCHEPLKQKRGQKQSWEVMEGSYDTSGNEKAYFIQLKGSKLYDAVIADTPDKKDAYLMAAAPELLEALKIGAKALSDLMNLLEKKYNADLNPLPLETMNNAIAKATAQ